MGGNTGSKNKNERGGGGGHGGDDDDNDDDNDDNKAAGSDNAPKAEEDEMPDISDMYDEGDVTIDHFVARVKNTLRLFAVVDVAVLLAVIIMVLIRFFPSSSLSEPSLWAYFFHFFTWFFVICTAGSGNEAERKKRDAWLLWSADRDDIPKETERRTIWNYIRRCRWNFYWWMVTFILVIFMIAGDIAIFTWRAIIIWNCWSGVSGTSCRNALLRGYIQMAVEIIYVFVVNLFYFLSLCKLGMYFNGWQF
jgi:hypothetical protein